jgi:FkbM family methyltransferase
VISKLHPTIRLGIAKKIKVQALVTLFDPNSIRGYSRTKLKPTLKRIDFNSKLKIFVDINDIIGFRTAINGRWDTTAQGIVQIFGVRNTLYLDIGANIGLTSIPVAQLGYTTCAFEPNPLALEVLFKNLSRNQSELEKFTVLPFALGDGKNSTSNRSLFVPLGNLGAASLNENWSPGVNPSIEYSVNQTSLDQVISFLYPPRKLSKFKFVIIKLDVEGNEVEVLKGGRNFIQRKRPIIIFEHNPRQNDGSSPDKYWKSLSRYSLCGIESGELTEFEFSRRYENVVAIPIELLSRVKSGLDSKST